MSSVKRTSSPYIVVRGSKIHGYGVFAKKNIPEGTRIIEYVGEKITKKESEHRAEIPMNQHKNDKTKGAVYIFTLNKRYDIDGNVAYNTARFINHACLANAEAHLIHGHIWIVAMRDIQKGEEITYNYGYGYEDHEDHPCHCGSPNCVGYILAEEHWPKLHFKKAKRSPGRKLTHQEILDNQKKNVAKPRLPFVVVLDNIRSAHNVGSAFRTADGVGIEKIYLCGITGFPPNAQISKTALGAEQVVGWEYFPDTVTAVTHLKEQGYQIVLLEQTDRSHDYHEYEPDAHTCLVIGNEVDGVSEDVVPLADCAIDIEMQGLKNSLNVSVAFGIASYHIGNRLRDMINRE